MGRSRPIGNTWVTDMRHCLDDAGAVVDMPGPALSLAAFLGSIAAWVTSGRSSADPCTNVACRRSPGRRRCSGEIRASFEADGETISWRCPVCGDHGVTRGWEGPPWDRRRGGAHWKGWERGLPPTRVRRDGCWRTARRRVQVHGANAQPRGLHAPEARLDDHHRHVLPARAPRWPDRQPAPLLSDNYICTPQVELTPRSGPGATASRPLIAP